MQYLAETQGLIHPFAADLLSGCAYDLRAGAVLRSRNRETSHDLAREDYLIECGECITVNTLEVIDFSKSYELEGMQGVQFIAHVINKHGLVAWGLFHPATVIDPGFKGPLALTFFNMGSTSLRIKFETPICKMVVVPVSTPKRLYGATQTPSYKQGSTDFSLVVDRAPTKASDEILRRMYGTPVTRLFERVDSLDVARDVLDLKRDQKEREERRAGRRQFLRSLFVALIGGIAALLMAKAWQGLTDAGYFGSSPPGVTDKTKRP
jgi:deoxycytidine triphosphate deaminase